MSAQDVVKSSNARDTADVISRLSALALSPLPTTDPRPKLHRRALPKLPTEVMCHLFAFCVEMDPAGRRSASDGRVALGWITVIHVCREWRVAALGCPALWSIIAFSLGDEWAKKMISLSSPMPIMVAPGRARTYRTGARLADDVADAIVKCLHRTEILSLGFMHPSWDTFLRRLTGPATLLGMARIERFSPEHLPLPEELFSLGAPELRCLELSGFSTMLWHAPILSKLTVLHLTMAWDRAEPLEHCETILEALGTMAALESLLLSMVFPYADDNHHHDDTVSHAMIQLRNLQIFIYEGSAEDCLFVLQHLTLPPSVTLDVAITDRHDLLADGIPQSMDFLSSYLGTHRADATPVTRVTLACIYRGANRLELHAWRGARTFALCPDVSLSFALGDSASPVDFAVDAFAQNFVGLVSWGTVEELALVQLELSPALMGILAAQAASLQRLVLQGDDALEALTFFAEHDECLQDGEPTPVLLPSLRTLEIRKAYLTDFVEDGAVEGEELPAWQERRAQVGHPVEILIFASALPETRWLY